jgi:uncharacterized Zn-binding protein involved in type VI secretion
MPAAKQGDQITASDLHTIQPPGTAPTVLTPHNFTGLIDGGPSTNVNIMGKPAGTQNSTATNTPPHLPIGGTFVNPPSNRGTIITGSSLVNINGKPAARNGDTAKTCNDPSARPVGTIVATGTVNFG